MLTGGLRISDQTTARLRKARVEICLLLDDFCCKPAEAEKLFDNGWVARSFSLAAINGSALKSCGRDPLSFPCTAGAGVTTGPTSFFRTRRILMKIV
jgi:hypothetical protein